MQLTSIGAPTDMYWSFVNFPIGPMTIQFLTWIVRPASGAKSLILPHMNTYSSTIFRKPSIEPSSCGNLNQLSLKLVSQVGCVASFGLPPH